MSSRHRRAAPPAELPAGTQLALVRRLMLIDTNGKLVQSPLTEMVQLRVLHEPTKIDGKRSFVEFKLRRRDLD